MAISTTGVTLKWGENEGSVTKVVDIKDFPDLGGPPEMIDVTTLSDQTQSFILGIQSMSALEFTANYEQADYEAVLDDAEKDLYYTLEFGDKGDEGVFKWQGQHTAYVVGNGVNASVDMKIVIAPKTKPELVV